MNIVDIGTAQWYYFGVNSKNMKTYKRIYQDPFQSNIEWTDIESLFKALGAEITEGAGSRMNGERAVFHRPHPESTTDKGAVKAVRRFLENAEVKL